MSSNLLFVLLASLLFVDTANWALSATVEEEVSKHDDSQEPKEAEDDLIPLLDEMIHWSAADIKSRVQQITAQLLKDYRAVSGVAYLDNRIYVSVALSNSILVFDAASPTFDKLPDIVIDDVKIIQDLTVDPVRKVLYVADISMHIWRLDPVTLTSTELIQTTFSPLSLSYSQESNQLVATGINLRGIYIYDIDNSGHALPNSVFVQLPKHLDVKHALRTTSGNYLVAHVGVSKTVRYHDQVSEFDPSGKVVRSFGEWRGSGNEQLNTPTYLAADADGSVLVADFNNGRVVRLSGELKFVEFVVQGAPVNRLSLAQQQHLLITGQSNNVGIYQLSGSA